MRWRLLTLLLIVLTALSTLVLAYRDRPPENTDKQSEGPAAGTAEVWEPPV